MKLQFFDTPPVPMRPHTKYTDIAAELISNEGRWAIVGVGGSGKISYIRKVLPKSIVVRQHKVNSDEYQIWASYKPKA